MSPERPTRPTPKRSRVSRPRVYRRMEERLAVAWKPLDELENRSLYSVKDSEGKYEIEREVLAKLIGERDRLAFVAESARFLLDSCDRAGMERIPRDKVTPTAVEKAMGATRQALASLDGDLDRASRS